jgi:hypothetical protein
MPADELGPVSLPAKQLNVQFEAQIEALTGLTSNGNSGSSKGDNRRKVKLIKPQLQPRRIMTILITLIWSVP